jgi:hypothetical protein
MAEVTSTHRLISADFLTPSYRIVGKIYVPHSGMLGLMNDTTSSFMEVQEVKLARTHMPTKLVDEYEMIDVVKSNIFAVCLTRREDVGPAALARGGYSKLNHYTIKVTSSVYELDGILDWAGRFDFAAIMVEGIRDFVPVFDTVLTAILIQNFRIESPAVLFNRRQVDLLAQMKKNTGKLNEKGKIA